MRSYLLFLALLSLEADAQVQTGEICKSPNNVFTAKVNLYAGELGYYMFEECGDVVNPNIGLEVGETYTFLQGDRSNFYHPLGFAYYADGAHADKPELEPGVTETAGNACADDMTCSAPMYYLDDTYLGEYSNLDSDAAAPTSVDSVAVPAATVGLDNFGLDDYEPLFFYPLPDWVDQGEFSVKLKFDDADYSKDLFYFCHIHQFMSGRIKLLKNGEPVNEIDDPPLGYEYDDPTLFDKDCGTYGLGGFQLPNSQCPSTFVCDMDDASSEVQAYGGCVNAMNCAMMAGMTTNGGKDPVSDFIYHMIPHHQNAVNMAKAYLKTDALQCDDLTGESVDCTAEVLMRSIINGQNAQIQTMRGYLDANGLPENDDCVVEISSVGSGDPVDDDGTSDAAEFRKRSTLFTSMAALLFAAAVL